MKTDPIVAQVRRIRAEIEMECGGDMHALYLKALAAQRRLAVPAKIGRTASARRLATGEPAHTVRRRKAAA